MHGGCLIQVIYVVHRAVAVVNWFWLAWRTELGQNAASPGLSLTSNATLLTVVSLVRLAMILIMFMLIVHMLLFLMIFKLPGWALRVLLFEQIAYFFFSTACSVPSQTKHEARAAGAVSIFLLPRWVHFEI